MLIKPYMDAVNRQTKVYGLLKHKIYRFPEHFYHTGMLCRAFKGAHVPSSVVDLRRNSSYFVLIIYIIQIPLLIIFTISM